MGFNKDQHCLELLNQWLIRLHRNLPLEKFFLHRNIKRIAIYGMGLYGRHLVRELANGRIEISYAIDRRKLPPYEGVVVCPLRADFAPVDAVVYTVIDGKDDVRNWLEKNFDVPIYSIEEVVFSYEDE